MMDEGKSWQEANAQSELGYSRTGIQRLHREWCKRGEAALIDHRGGSRYRKATEQVQEKIIECCEENEEIRSPQLATEIKVEFGVELNPNYVSILRRQLGLQVPVRGRPKRETTIVTPQAETGEGFSP
ncbi:MAG: hypothetical protein GY847_21255 [Proteobacteria bacterium]|nr:hypothetical protein [Pseudomonadota bacterium]